MSKRSIAVLVAVAVVVVAIAAVFFHGREVWNTLVAMHQHGG